MTMAQKEQCRVNWARQKHDEIVRSQTEKSCKSDHTKSTRKYLTKQQLVAHYKSKREAINHIKFCKKQSGPEWIKQNAMAGTAAYLVIEIEEEKKTKHSWEVSEQTTVTPSVYALLYLCMYEAKVRQVCSSSHEGESLLKCKIK